MGLSWKLHPAIAIDLTDQKAEKCSTWGSEFHPFCFKERRVDIY
jgi:hypothetical protein